MTFRVGCVATILALMLTGCGGGTAGSFSGGGTSGGTTGGTTGGNQGGTGGVPSNIAVSVTPKLATAASTGTQMFVATVSGDPANAGVAWQVDGVAGGNASTGTIATNGLYTIWLTGGMHTVAAASVSDATKSDSGVIAVTDLPGVLTNHNNLARDGTNTQEYVLNPSNVTAATFGKQFSCPVDGSVYAQPLWASNVVERAKHNLMAAATAHDSVYGFRCRPKSMRATLASHYAGRGAWRDRRRNDGSQRRPV